MIMAIIYKRSRLKIFVTFSKYIVVQLSILVGNAKIIKVFIIMINEWTYKSIEW